MTENALLEQLEQIAHKLGVQLRYESLNTPGVRSDGGLCKVMGKHMILVNRNDSRRKKIAVLAKSLHKLDLEGIFIPPAVRTLIENQTM